MFFACFFGVLYYIRRIALPELGGYEATLTPYAGFTGAWPAPAGALWVTLSPP